MLYHTPARRDLQDVLTCIRHGVTLATAGRLIRPNAEHDLKSPQRMAQLFADEPVLVERTREVASRCTFSLSEIRYRYPAERLPDGKTSSDWLRELTLGGARERFGDDVPPAIREQIDRELALIDELDYGGYFLTMWEIVGTAGRRASSARGAARPPTRWSATAWGSPRSIRRGSSCCSSASCRASGASRRTSTSTSCTPAARR